MAEETIPQTEAERKAADKRAKARAYYLANRDRIAARQKISDAKKYALNKAEINARRMAWTAANRERQKEVGRKSYAKNAERLRQEAKDRYYNNKEKKKERDKAYRDKNKDKVRLWNRIRIVRRRARQKLATGSFNHSDILFILKMQKNKCGLCRVSLKSGYHIDHIIAIAKGGSNDRRNLQALCPTCNRRKSAKDPIDFAREIGLLL